MKSWTKVRGELPPASQAHMDARLEETLAGLELRADLPDGSINIDLHAS